MKQTVTVWPKEAKKREYPYWGETKEGRLVFFESSKTGVIHQVSENEDQYKIGTRREDWVESIFTPIVGTITITQE